MVDEATAQLAGLIEPEDLAVVYQPIVDLEDQSVFACEALARSLRDDCESPTQLFRRAAILGKTGALGRVLRQRIARAGIQLHLFVNIHPFELNGPWLLDEADPIFEHSQRIYLEITETMPLGSFDEFKHALDTLRARPNVHFVVDDLGAGFSNLRRISDLAPSVVKIDKNLITGLPDSQRQQRLLAGIVRLCTDLGARVVAEGIETEDEFLASRDAGAHYGQGFLWARPAAPLPTIRTSPRGS
jgi:EAL domain-containing protein (putative c-di-GMP-specific phosphodiesterase class I)